MAEDQVITGEPQPLEKLYGVVKDRGLYTKSFDEFKTKYSDPENMTKLYDVVSSRGLYTKTKDEFIQKYSAPKEPVKPAIKRPSTFGQLPDPFAVKPVAPNTLGVPESFDNYLEDKKQKAIQKIDDELTGNLELFHKETEAAVRNAYKPDVREQFDPNKPAMDNVPMNQTAQRMSDKFGQVAYEQNKKTNAPEYLQIFDQKQRELEDNPDLKLHIVRRELKNTDKKKYNEVTAAQALLEKQQDAGDDPILKKKLSDAIDRVEKGENDYVGGQFVKPMGVVESFKHSWQESNKLRSGFYDLINNSPEEIIAEQEAVINNQDPFETVKVPEGFLAEHLGGLGGLPIEGIMAGTAAGFATAAVGGEAAAPAVGKAAAIWASSQEMAEVGTRAAYNQYYKEIRNEQKKQGKNSEEDKMAAYTEAFRKAKIAGTADFGMGVIMGAGIGGKLAPVRFSEGATSVLKNTFKNVLTEVKTASKLGGLAAGTTLAKNVANEHENKSEGLADSFESMFALHFANKVPGLLLGAATRAIAIPGTIKGVMNENKVKLALARQPEGVVEMEIGKALQHGEITKEQANKALTDVAEFKEKIAGLPTNMTEDATLGALAKIELRDKKEALLEVADPARQPEIKETIKKINEEILAYTKEKEKAEPKAPKELSDPLQKSIDNGTLQGMNADVARAALMTEEGATNFYKDVADQALNKIAGDVTESQVSMDRAIKVYGKEVVDKAVEMFPPKERKVSVIKPGEIQQHETTTISPKVPDEAKAESADIGAAEKVSEPTKEVSKQESINKLLDKAAALNKQPKNAVGRSAEVNEIRLAAKELGLKFDSKSGKVVTKTGGKVIKINSDKPSLPAENFDSNKYNKQTRSHIETVKQDANSLVGMGITGADGRVLSKTQLDAAVKSINEGKPTNGAKAIYDFIENSVKEGGVELEDKATGNRVKVPVDEYFAHFKEPAKELTDKDIMELNYELNEDFFTNLEQEYGQESLHTEVESTPTREAKTSTTQARSGEKPTRASTESTAKEATKKIETIEDFEAELKNEFRKPSPMVGVEGATTEGGYKESSYKDANSIIEHAKETFKDDPLVSRVSNFLEPILADKDIKIEVTKLKSGVRALSHGGRIELDLQKLGSDKVAIPIALHELMHEATVREIETNPAFKEELDRVLGVVRKALGVESNELLIPQLVKEGVIDIDKYGTANAKELVAEVFTNPTFNNYLKGIEYQGKNLFERIVEAIVSYFDKKYGKVSDAKGSIDAKDMAEFIMQLTERVVDGKGEKSQSTNAAIEGDAQKKRIQDIIKRSEKVPADKIAASISKIAEISIEEAKAIVEEVRGASGITHAANEVRREMRALPEYEKSPQTFEAWNTEAEKLVKEGYDVEKLMDKIEQGHDPTPVENAIRKIYIATLDAEIARNPTDELLAKQKRFIEIGDLANSRAGRNLVSLKGEGSPLSTISDFYVAKMGAAGVEKLTEQQKKDTKEAFENVQKSEENAKAALKLYEDEIAKLKAENEILKQKKETTKKTKGDWEQQRKDAVAGAREALKKLRTGESGLSAVPLPGVRELIAIAPHVKKYIGGVLGEGVQNLHEVVAKAYNEFKDILEGITEKDIHNILAGEYNEAKPTRSELAAKMRDLKDEAFYINKLEKLENGQEPKAEKAKVERNQKIKDLQQKIKEFQKEHPDELKKLSAIRKRNETETEKIKERIKNGDFETKKPVPFLEDTEMQKRFPKEYNAALDAVLKKEEARHEFDIALLRDQMSRRSTTEKATDLLAKSVGTAKAIVTGIDDSAVAIQTYMSLLVRPRTGAKALYEHIRQGVSQKKFNRWLAALHSSSDFQFMKDAGLDVTEPRSLKEAEKEEIFNNRFSGTVKVKGKEYKLLDVPLKPFERAFTTLGNVTRVVGFRTISANYMREGYTWEKDPELFKSLAKRLNTETGRGQVNDYVQHANKIVTLGIWSPKLMAAKFNILGVSDAASLVLSKAGTKGYYRQLHPKERLAAIKDVAQFATTVMALSYGFALAFGGEVDDDPRSSTFMDIKLDNGKSYNFTGGFGGYIRSIAQFVTASKSRDGNVRNVNPIETGLQFFKGKRPPVTSAIMNTISGKDYMGRPTDALNEAQNALLPISMKGIYEQIQRDGAESFFTQGIPTFFGFNVKDERDYPKPASKGSTRNSSGEKREKQRKGD